MTYSNEAKTEVLGVPAEMIAEHGAVSNEVAEAMADGALARFEADIGVGITGIAGPDGGTEEKPVGYVCVCVKTVGRREARPRPRDPGHPRRHPRALGAARDAPRAPAPAGRGLPALKPAGRAVGSDERNPGGIVPAKGIHHVDLAVADVDRSLGFYLALLGPLGWAEEVRYPTYRGTEEVVYLQDPITGAMLGIRQADGGEYRYHSVGIEHLAFEVDERKEVEAAYSRCSPGTRTFTSRPKRIATSRTTTHSSSSIRTGFELKSSCGVTRRARLTLRRERERL